MLQNPLITLLMFQALEREVPYVLKINVHMYSLMHTSVHVYKYYKKKKVYMRTVYAYREYATLQF